MENFKTAQALLDKSFADRVKNYRESGENPIIVLQGASDKLLQSLPHDWLADPETISQEKPAQYYDKSWFAAVFGELIKEKDCHVLSFA